LIRDLALTGDACVATDVLVIGAGTVGLPMAVKLAERGHQVLVIESGGSEQSEDTHELNAVTHARLVYGGAAHGRFRCLGGTSTRWGGALVPFSKGDYAPGEWPVSPEEIEVHLPAVEALFGLGPGTYEGDPVFKGAAADFRARLAKWPSFRNRNVANLLAKPIQSSPRLDIWLNASATDFEVSGGRLKCVRARSRNGSTLVVTAREIVFAAGAIETTRLLLLMDQQHGDALFAPDQQLGRYFSDHLSLAVADIDARDRVALNMQAGFRFERGGSMRNVRYELTDNTPLRRALPACFAHIAFTQAEDGGFAAARDLFRQVQRGGLPDLRLVTRLALSAPWLARAMWWRYVRRRLLYPSGAKVQLHMVIEQIPLRDNCIRLSQSSRDVFGQPLAEINWDVAARDSDNLLNAVRAFETAWASSSLAQIAQLQIYPTQDITRELASHAGIYHPVGSVRMAHTSKHGVVDSSLRPFRVRNVSVASTAVLPRSGGANPTMMLLMLGLRCVDSISAALNEGRQQA
jgi:choline dehydrogenase-like flavoprotein